jgi:type II secretory pathway pseudopilin PulG
MAHRAEEKERRRQERIAQEEAARKAAARKRTLQVGGGVVLGLAVIAVIAIVALAGGGGSKDKTADISKLTADAKAAGCTFSQFKSEGRNHTASKVTYKTNPPTSGNHNPTPAQDGIYAPGNEPNPENYVHSLEHGRIEFQYKPGTSQADIAKLRSLAEEPLNDSAGYHVLLFENNTNMPAQFAATAWTKSITCPTLSTQAIGAMREFRTAFTDKGPEFIP